MRLCILCPILLLFGLQATAGSSVSRFKDVLKSKEMMDVIAKSAEAPDSTKNDFVKDIHRPPPSQYLRSLKNTLDNAPRSRFEAFSDFVASARDDVLEARRSGEKLESKATFAHDNEKETRLDTNPEVRRSLQETCPWASATPLTLTPEGVIITSTTAGAPSNLPSHCGASSESNGASPTKWYSISVTARTTIALMTCSEKTEFDTVISVFRRTSLTGCGAECVDMNDDHGLGSDSDICSHSSLHSALLFETESSSETYYIAVSGYGSGDWGSFDLFLVGIPEEGTTPDDGGSCPLTSAALIDYDPHGVMTTRGTTTGAPSNLPTADGCSVNNGSPTIWYRFLPTADADSLAFTTCSDETTFDTVITVFRQSSGGNCAATCLVRNDDHGVSDPALCSHSDYHSLTALEGVSAGETYYVAISGFDSGAYGDFALIMVTLGDDPPPPPPPPIGCSFLTNALWINYHPDGMVIAGTTAGAPSTLPGTCSSPNNGSPTVWYKLTTAHEGPIVITTCSESTTFDTVVTVYRDDSGGSSSSGGDDCDITCVGANDDHGLSGGEICAFSTGHSAMNFESTPPADTYYIAVSGYDSGEYGSFEFFVLPIAPSGTTPTDPTPSPDGPTLAEANLLIDIEPVFGPFVSDLHVAALVDGSEAFFRSMLFGDSDTSTRQNNVDEIIEVEFIDADLLEADNENFPTASKLRVELSVQATYDGETDFQIVLEGFVEEQPELYADSIRAAEESSGNRGYFSSVETIMLKEIEDKPTSPPVPVPSPTPADKDDSGGKGALIGGIVGGVWILIIIIGVGIFFYKKKKKQKSPTPGDGGDRGDDRKHSGAEEDTQNYDHSHTQDYNGNPATMIEAPVTVLFVAKGMKVSPDAKVGINLARCEGREDAIFLSSISNTSIFADQGLREGMIVRTINGVPVKTVEQASHIIRDFEGVLTIEAELQHVPSSSMFEASQ